jgi:hypothetical protein
VHAPAARFRRRRIDADRRCRTARPARRRPGTHREPNNIFGGEFCAGANATEAFMGLWGWADANCDLRFPYICEIAREWLRQAAPPGPARLQAPACPGALRP